MTPEQGDFICETLARILEELQDISTAVAMISVDSGGTEFAIDNLAAALKSRNGGPTESEGEQ